MAAIASGMITKASSASKRVLVTGANRGIGFDLSKQLAKSGWRVVVAGRSERNVAVAVEQIQKHAGGTSSVQSVVVDVSDPTSIAKQLDIELDCIVNNAAIYEEEWNLKAWVKALQTNLLGPLDVVETAGRKLAKNGLILNVSSGYGTIAECPSKRYRDTICSASSLDELRALATDGFEEADPSSAAYVPTYKINKCALNRATQLLAKDTSIRKRNISVAACCPGWVRTRMGGSSASRSVEEGSASLRAAIDLHFDAVAKGRESPVNGGFFRDGKPIGW